MQLNLNLIDNSYDYINESLRYYTEFAYNESHDPDRDDINEKKKWKTTFILLVQAMELLIKEKLYRINPVLLYDNIDVCSVHSKTIGYSKSIIRLSNFKPNLITYEEQKFLKICGDTRNEFVHYKVDLDSINIKMKYCRLFKFYKTFHLRCFGKAYINEKYKFQIDNIMLNTKDFKIYRGYEFTAKQLKEQEKALNEGQIKCYAISKKVAYERVKYGFEEKINEEELFCRKNNCEYCGDCLAKRGEYHQIGCDIEICPKCGKQLISCNCITKYISKQKLEELKQKNKIQDIKSI